MKLGRDYRADWEEAVRNALIWRKQAEDAEETLGLIADAYDDLRLWAPRQRGYAAAVARFVDEVHGLLLSCEGIDL